jgi:drug/metabolite transporter (DMT)-like permease
MRQTKYVGSDSINVARPEAGVHNGGMVNRIHGELAALSVSLLWTISALSFEAASRRVGSLAVNIVRLILALIVFTAYSLIAYHSPVPAAGADRWLALVISGVIGFFIGDLFLFKAFVLIGSRMSMLVMCSAPALAAIAGALFLDDRMSGMEILSLVVVSAGVALVILVRKGDAASTVSVRGFLYALMGAAGQAGGLVLSRAGVRDFDPMLATQIRVMAGLAAFALFALLIGRVGSVVRSIEDRGALGFTAIGALFGPVAGVSLSLFAVKYAPTGIAMTLMSLTPLLMALMAWVRGRERIRILETGGIVLACVGVAVLFLF